MTADRRPVTRAGVLIVGVWLVVAGLLTGCSSDDSAAPAASRSAASGQSSMPPPVSAHTTLPSAPKAIFVDNVDQSARILSVATDAKGVLLPPQDVNEVGWWVDSALPGSGAGMIVVTGHVDDVDQGRGFAAAFSDLAVGSSVTLTTSDGQSHRYRVTRKKMADKSATGGLDELNRQDGPETLALVTCGGPFVGPPLGYRDNVLVFAVPA